MEAGWRRADEREIARTKHHPRDGWSAARDPARPTMAQGQGKRLSCGSIPDGSAQASACDGSAGHGFLQHGVGLEFVRCAIRAPEAHDRHPEERDEETRDRREDAEKRRPRVSADTRPRHRRPSGHRPTTWDCYAARIGWSRESTAASAATQSSSSCPGANPRRSAM